MKKFLLFFLSVLFVCFSAIGLFACVMGDREDSLPEESSAEDFYYTENERKTTITGYKGNSATIRIPSVIDGNEVTAIGDYAFDNCEGITTMIIPDTVTSIGSYAFSGCMSLVEVRIGKGVKIIGECAFDSCDAIEEIYITDLAAWCGVTGLDGLMSYGTESKKLFLNDKLITDLVIPDGVTSVEDGAFFKNKYITSITIPKSIKSFKNAFFCENLKDVYITDLTSWCKISGTVYLLGYTPSEKDDGINLYLNNKLVKDLVIPDEITAINDYAFISFNLSSITVPDHVTSIGNCAFTYCRGVKSIIIGKNVNSIGFAALSCYGGLESIIVNEENKTYYAKGNCVIENETDTVVAGCKNSVIPSDGSVIAIGGYAFAGCAELNDVIIPNCVTTIGESAFLYCSKLTEIVIPDGVTEIGRDAFEGCAGLTNVIIPDSVITLGSYAFGYCINLKSITIGKGVTEINDIFTGCKNLASLKYEGTKEEWKKIVSYPYLFEDTLVTEVICKDGTIIAE